MQVASWNLRKAGRSPVRIRLLRDGVAARDLAATLPPEVRVQVRFMKPVPSPPIVLIEIGVERGLGGGDHLVGIVTR